MYQCIISFLKDKKLKFISITTLIMMLAAHGYVYLNTIFSHDSMKIIYWGESLMYDTVEIGRYIIPLYLIVRGKYYPPFLIGILSIIFMILIVYFLVKLFDIKNKLHIVLVSGILSTCCTITLLNATYIEYSDMYLLSFLLAIISAYLLIKVKAKTRFLLAIVLFVISMGIYQTSLPIFLCVILFSALVDLLNKQNVLKCIKNLIIYMIVCVIALGIYYLIYKFIIVYYNITPSSCYNSLNNVGKYDGIRSMIDIFINQYKRTYEFIVGPSTYYKSIVAVINIVLLCTSVILVIIKGIKNKLSIIQDILILMLIAGISFVVNCTYFISSGVLHQLMIFAMFLLYVFYIVILEQYNTSNKIFKVFYIGAISSFIIMIISSIIYSNQVYLKKDMEFEATKMTMTRLIQNIEQMDGYDIESTPIVFVGYLHKGPLSYNKPELDYNSVGLDGTYGLTYYLNYKQFLNNYMGYPITVLDEDTSKEYAEKEEVKEMKPFPAKSSYKIIDGVIVVKFSEG